MSTADALFTTDGSIAFLTFDRPAARNAMTWAMYDALVETCERVDANDALRVLVLRANGEAFAAGTDIRQFTAFASGDDGLAYERRIDAVIARLESVTVPTIAQIEGIAAGGGCAIALACDLRVCTPAARLGVPIARTLGNCLSMSNYARLVDLIGPARTKDLLFTGRLMDAAEADALGRVTRMATADDIDAEVRALAETLSAHAPLTIRATKDALRQIASRRRPDAADGEAFIAACYASQDFREGIDAFLAKRRPHFTGR